MGISKTPLNDKIVLLSSWASLRLGQAETGATQEWGGFGAGKSHIDIKVTGQGPVASDKVLSNHKVL